LRKRSGRGTDREYDEKNDETEEFLKRAHCNPPSIQNDNAPEAGTFPEPLKF